MRAEERSTLVWCASVFVPGISASTSTHPRASVLPQSRIPTSEWSLDDKEHEDLDEAEEQGTIEFRVRRESVEMSLRAEEEIKVGPGKGNQRYRAVSSQSTDVSTQLELIGSSTPVINLPA